MSDDFLVIEATIDAEAWWIVAIVGTLLPDGYFTNVSNVTRPVWSATQTFKVTEGSWKSPKLWNITIRGDENRAVIRISTPTEYRFDWQELIAKVKTIANEAHYQ